METTTSTIRKGAADATGGSLWHGVYATQDGFEQNNWPGVILPPELASRLRRQHGDRWRIEALRQIESTILLLHPNDMRILQAAARSLHVAPEQLVAALLSPQSKTKLPLWSWDSAATVAASRTRESRRLPYRFSGVLVVVGLLVAMFVGMWLTGFIMFSTLVPR